MALSMEELYLSQARNATSVHDCMAIYDKWAATYNSEVNDEAQAYVAPVLVANVALRSSKNPAKSLILDAGCGTGLVGEALAKLGARDIDGIDLSVPMLGIAKETGVYRNLAQVDLMQPLGIKDDAYDIVTCVGTFTSGHVGPTPALEEFVRIVKKGGTVVVTILDKFWLSAGFSDVVQQLQAQGLVTIVAEEAVDYVKGHGDKAILLELRKGNPTSM